MKPWRYHLLLLSLMIFFSCQTNRVLAQKTAIEFWPEIDAWLRLSPEWRFSTFVQVSKNNETKYREGSLSVQVDYAFGKTHSLHMVRLYDANRAQSVKPFLLRGGYLKAKSLNDKGDPYKEDMGFVEFHLRNPLKGMMLISHRLRTDLRWIADDSLMSYRLRYRLMIEKEISGKKTWVPYVSVEPYYDSRYDEVNRVRVIGGTSVSWSSHYLLEGDITYQHESRSSVTNLFALNIILHLFFETRSSKAQ